MNREIIGELLTILGCEVDCANDGRGAVRAVSESNYSMVLMDCQMPVMDGYEATRQIRSREAGQRRIPIIAATAHAFESEGQRAVAAGMDDHLPKPITLGSLAAMVYAWAHGGQAIRRRTTSTTHRVRLLCRASTLTCIGVQASFVRS